MNRLRFVTTFLFFAILTPAKAQELPRVLVLGDSLQRGTFAEASRELKGKVEFKFPKLRVNNVSDALANFGQLIGETQWDLIYFNYGLGDLFYKDPTSKEIRAMGKDAGGVRVSTPVEYRKNLEALVKRLKATKTKLLWASTTPIVTVNAFPSYQGNLYDAHSEIEFNKIAASIMQSHSIPINDMHAFILSQFGPDEKHPGHNSYQKALSGTHRGKKKEGFQKSPMWKPVTAAILEQLK